MDANRADALGKPPDDIASPEEFGRQVVADFIRVHWRLFVVVKSGRAPPQEGGFQWETLELKDERFRYWFSSDVILPNRPKYPIVGSYEFRNERLILSSGETYTVRPSQGNSYSVEAERHRLLGSPSRY